MTGAPLVGAEQRLRNALRATILMLLVVAPLAIGSVQPQVYVPLLLISAGVGALSWARGRWARAHGSDVPRVPGARLLVGFLLLVAVQLVPLPSKLLGLASPGSRAYYEYISLLPEISARPISVSPPDTARGLAFLAVFGLLYAAVVREFRDPRWRRRMIVTIVGVGVLITVEALVQAALWGRRIFGLWQPIWDWNVFGPYVNRNHFAGYMALAIPLATGLLADAWENLRIAMRQRRRAWLALADSQGMAFVRQLAFFGALLTGLVASGSRGGLMAVGAAAAAWPILRRRPTSLIVGLGAVIVSLALIPRVMQGVGSSARDPTRRLELWSDVIPMTRDFPIFGAGFNAFGTSYRKYQSIWDSVWFGEAHNDYLQCLVDTGIAGAALQSALVGMLLLRAFQNAATGPLEAGVAAALVAGCAHAAVDFNWQVPANAATFVVLAGLGVQASGRRSRTRLDPSGGPRLVSTSLGEEG